jgi:hypothetical protein
LDLWRLVLADNGQQGFCDFKKARSVIGYLLL